MRPHYVPGLLNSDASATNLEPQYGNIQIKEARLNLTSMGLIDYMNKNISCLVLATLRAQHGLLANDIEVTSLEVDGYFEKSDGKSYFLTFDKSCETLHDFKREMLTYVRNYRRFLI